MATERFAFRHAVHLTENATSKLWLAKANCSWWDNLMPSGKPHAQICSWFLGRIQYFRKGGLRYGPSKAIPHVGRVRDILPEKSFKIELLRNGIWGFLRTCQHVIMSHTGLETEHFVAIDISSIIIHYLLSNRSQATIRLHKQHFILQIGQRQNEMLNITVSFIQTVTAMELW